MKYILIGLMALNLSLFGQMSYAEDTILPAVTETIVIDNAVESSDIKTDLTVSGQAQTQPAVPTTSAWQGLLLSLLAILIPIFGALVVVIVKIVIKKLEKKYGVDAPEAVEQMTEGLLVKGINWTENWAKVQAAKPTSENKMAETIRFALEKASTNEVLKAKIEQRGRELVEKLLKEKITPDSATPKE